VAESDIGPPMDGVQAPSKLGVQMSAAVQTRRLTKQFGANRGINDVSIEVRVGEVFGFLGPNGAGKSTTIRLLLGLHRPTSGQVRVFDLDPGRDPAKINRLTGYLPGELSLYPRLTGRQHLDRFARIRAMTDVSYRDELVQRFNVELDRPVRTLSKGNRQKIGLVAAFMHRPDLLVLDEPTAGLDPLLQDEFVHLVRESATAGQTVFLSSHELDEVQRVVDRLAIIKDGRIIVTDSIDGLRKNAPRTIEFRFPAPIDPQRFAGHPGVHVLASSDTRITLSVTGPVAALLRVAADLDALDVSAPPADLDELFLSYYRTDPDASISATPPPPVRHDP
jgi:ABC-2 type transport system ATP-binding protein